MSYYQGPPPGGQPPYQQYATNQGYNQGYQQGPPPPMNQQQGYPPQQQGWGQPPPQGYGPPPGQFYPPQGAPYGSPAPQQQWGAPPQQPPPGQYGYGAPPGAPQGYGPPPGQYGPPAMPSPGYDLRQRCPTDMSRAADDLRAAMKGFGTNENQLIKVMSSLGPLEIEGVKQAYSQRHRRDLMKDVHSETSGYFREALEAMIRGPLDQDCQVIREAIDGVGTKESALDDVLLSRSNADIAAIKAHYQHKWRHSLESDVKGDLSAKTERMYDMIMAGRREEESAPVIPQQVDQWVQQLYDATEGRRGVDQLTVCTTLTARSDGQLRAIAQNYRAKYHRSLEEVIKKEFSGHMEDALLYIVGHAVDPAKHDAQLLEESMAGLGTKDKALVRRIVMIHWDKQRLQQCKAAYKHFYKKDLAQRVRDETSGDYKKLMVACLNDGVF